MRPFQTKFYSVTTPNKATTQYIETITDLNLGCSININDNYFWQVVTPSKLGRTIKDSEMILGPIFLF